jgi:hypothetical protein
MFHSHVKHHITPNMLMFIFCYSITKIEKTIKSENGADKTGFKPNEPKSDI